MLVRDLGPRVSTVHLHKNLVNAFFSRKTSDVPRLKQNVHSTPPTSWLAYACFCGYGSIGGLRGDPGKLLKI